MSRAISLTPSGWASSSLANLVGVDGVFVDGDWVESKDQDPAGEIRLLQLADIGDGKFLNKSNRWINDNAFFRLRCTEIKEGDVLIARMPDPLGRACLMPAIPGKCVTVVDVAIFRCSQNEFDNRWLMHAINSPQFRKIIGENSSGTTRKRIARGRLGELEIPIAPRDEQRRIADKLDTILTRVDALNDRLGRITPLLKRFRQSVLAAATSGRLTADWRSQKAPDSIEEDWLISVRKLAASSSKEQRIINDLVAYSFGSLPKGELPSCWLRTSIGMAGAVSNGSTPSRGMLDYWGGSIPWVSSGEVRNNRVDETKECISQLGFESSSVRNLPVGTVLIAMIGEGKTRGQSALLNIEATINQNVAAVVPVAEILDSKYLWYWFQGQYENNRQAGNGTGPQALNCQKVRELPLNLPSLKEQTEIVRRVEILFSYADRLDARLQTARTAADRLTPALLAKAFRGELVPQDPNDEPASELLRRLREARVAEVSAKPKRGRKSVA